MADQTINDWDKSSNQNIYSLYIWQSKLLISSFSVNNVTKKLQPSNSLKIGSVSSINTYSLSKLAYYADLWRGNFWSTCSTLRKLRLVYYQKRMLTYFMKILLFINQITRIVKTLRRIANFWLCYWPKMNLLVVCFVRCTSY